VSGEDVECRLWGRQRRGIGLRPSDPLDLADHEAEYARLEALGVRVTTAEHAWVLWRLLSGADSEGNTVEWVCYDETIG
jgi:hypothetical protein